MNWNNGMGYIRYIILPNGNWQQILADSYNTETVTIKIKQNKNFIDRFDACIFKLISARAHHIFYQTESFGTILMDNVSIGLEKFCIAYSKQSDGEVIVLKGHSDCFDLYDIEIYKNGKLVRKSINIGKKLYNSASEILKPMYASYANTEIGQPTIYEELPYLLPFLNHFGWTEELMDQKKWQMATTNLD
ncbi:hypothetical protein IRZ71_08430 [Flavobacterium sp. ANB]|uniref:hypothetical protein n=1 Tax=unclassified Flavobacterium TaxID=196869 RepID=UPI0012B70ECA|nr:MULTISPECIES: hypothetical protein [unclassified Flavobacterium]MBF4516366.1 hypothetical protein [Flavobacterium sp. ANB]MTD69737.1 hypothetical protein [Flavobacterium sp. LC2016-13]